MTQGFQSFTKRYVNVLGVFIGVAVAGSILLSSGCGMVRPNTPRQDPDTVRPTSTITFPTAGANVGIGTTVSITGAASDAGGGTVAKVEVSVDGGATFSAATGTTAWSFNWTPATPGQVTIRSRATDNSGNVQDPPAQITVTGDFGGQWTAQGPGPTQNGQVEHVTPNNEVVGAIHAVAAHPTDSNIHYVGAVNGGIWRTGNATAASPTWTPLTDNFASLSIGALEFDPTDPTRRTLVAGIGRFSSFSRNGGPLTGILRTTDGGDNWARISPSILMNQNISGIAARGATLLASATGGGVFRSADGGINWVMVSGGNGLPAGGVNTSDLQTTRLQASRGTPWIYRRLRRLMAKSRDSTLADRDPFVFRLRSIGTIRIQSMWPAIVRTIHFPTSSERIISREGCFAVIRPRLRARFRPHSGNT